MLEIFRNYRKFSWKTIFAPGLNSKRQFSHRAYVEGIEFCEWTVSSKKGRKSSCSYFS